MKKNNIISFKADTELLDLLNETLNKINSETNIKIKKSDFIRIGLKRLCFELKSGEIQSAEVLFSKTG